MNTLFDLNTIPEKQPDSKPQSEFVIVFMDTEGVEWVYTGGIESEQGLQWVQRDGRKLPKRYAALYTAMKIVREVNRQRSKATIAAGIVARVVAWRKP